MNTRFKLPKVPLLKGRYTYVINQCRGRAILHIGCADAGLTAERISRGEFLHGEIQKVATQVYGFDCDTVGIFEMQKQGFSNLYSGDVENADAFDIFKDLSIDVIVATELIEHLNNPGLFFKNIKPLFNEDTQMVISVPNGLRLNGIWQSLQGYEYVHPDHNYWFSYHTLMTLIQKNGFKIIDMAGYVFSFNHPVNRLFSKINPFFVADGILASVRPI